MGRVGGRGSGGARLTGVALWPVHDRVARDWTLAAYLSYTCTLGPGGLPYKVRGGPVEPATVAKVKALFN